jgi:hypothetical protein
VNLYGFVGNNVLHMIDLLGLSGEGGFDENHDTSPGPRVQPPFELFEKYYGPNLGKQWIGHTIDEIYHNVNRGDTEAKITLNGSFQAHDSKFDMSKGDSPKVDMNYKFTFTLKCDPETGQASLGLENGDGPMQQGLFHLSAKIDVVATEAKHGMSTITVIMKPNFSAGEDVTTSRNSGGKITANAGGEFKKTKGPEDNTTSKGGSIGIGGEYHWEYGWSSEASLGYNRSYVMSNSYVCRCEQIPKAVIEN